MLGIFLRILECTNTTYAGVYWCEPGKSVADGLRSLRGDADTIAMSNMTSTCKNILMYVDHFNFLESQTQVEHSSSERKSKRAEKTSKGSHEDIQIEDGGVQDLCAHEDSEADSDFIDSDYELDIDDDDLFGQNVDDIITDEEANTKGKEVASEDELEEDNGARGGGQMSICLQLMMVHT